MGVTGVGDAGRVVGEAVGLVGGVGWVVGRFAGCVPSTWLRIEVGCVVAGALDISVGSETFVGARDIGVEVSSVVGGTPVVSVALAVGVAPDVGTGVGDGGDMHAASKPALDANSTRNKSRRENGSRIT